MAADQEQFQRLLSSLLSVDNSVRGQAETAYTGISPENKVIFLLNTIQNCSVAQDERQFAAVMLRRLFSAEFPDFFPKLSVEAQQDLKARVLSLFEADQSNDLRLKTCDVITELARNCIDDEGNNTWPEFLQFLFKFANDESPMLREFALRMFSSLPGVFGNQQVHFLDVIKQMLRQSLMDASSYSVRFQAVKAICAFLMIHEKGDPVYHHFTDLLPALVQTVAESVDKNEEDDILQSLIELAENAPKFLRPQLTNIIVMCLRVLTTEEVEDLWKHLALELIVTLCESGSAMMRKEASKFIPSFIPMILNMMADIEDEEDWSVSDEIVDEDNESNYVVAESALDRLAFGLGGRTVLPHVVEYVPELLRNQNWKCRYAALMALSTVGEGCYKQMKSGLHQMVEVIINYMRDPHPRVRYAACNAIGQMSSDFAPSFEKKFHSTVIPALLMVLDDNLNPRVQAHAGAALVNFSEDCPKPILIRYLNEIMAKLEGILSAKFNELVEKGTKLVLEQIVTTIASVADTSEEQFIAYYDRLMPCLKYIIQNANTTELQLLRGKTIECVSLIGRAVGREKFIKDATEIMDLLLKTQSDDDFPEDDPQTSYLISAWSKICKVLGKQFQVYLPLVMGPVMRAASHRPEVALFENEAMDNMPQDEDWQFVSLGVQQNFGIRTAGMEDKANACDMLVCYARELKEAFADYVEPVVKLMVPMLKFYFHEHVRIAAAQSLPYLLEAVKNKNTSYVLGMWQYIYPALLTAIESEPETGVKHEHMASMAKCIETLGKEYMTEEFINQLLKGISDQLNAHFERAVERLEKRKDEDYDEVVEEQLEDEDNDDNYTISKISEILHSLFAIYGDQFFPYFDKLLPHFIKMLGSDMTSTDRERGLCVFDDVIEYGGAACVKYQQYFIRPILEGVGDKSPAIRQAASYGCGALAVHGGPQFAGTCADAIPLLVKVINDPQGRTDENINATENAISAVTKILKYNNSSINVDEVLPHWFSWLPVWEDVDETSHIYGYLCDLIESSNPIILGSGSNSNLARIVAVVGEALARDALPHDSTVLSRLINIIRRASTDPTFPACLAHLNSELQVALHKALQTPTAT